MFDRILQGALASDNCFQQQQDATGLLSFIGTARLNNDINVVDSLSFDSKLAARTRSSLQIPGEWKNTFQCATCYVMVLLTEMARVRNASTHSALQADLIDHLWELKQCHESFMGH